MMTFRASSSRSLPCFFYVSLDGWLFIEHRCLRCRRLHRRSRRRCRRRRQRRRRRGRQRSSRYKYLWRRRRPDFSPF